MPLLKPRRAEQIFEQKVAFTGSLYEQIQQYCAWAGIDDEQDFIVEACEYVLARDSEWKRYRKSVKPNKQAGLAEQSQPVQTTTVEPAAEP